MEYKELEKKREKKTKDGTCGDGGLLSLRFVLHHQHTQVETRDNHPLPDSPPSISSHGGTKKKKEKTKTSCWTSFSASSSRTGSNAFIDNILSPVYKALTQFFFSFFPSFRILPCFSFLFSPISWQIDPRWFIFLSSDKSQQSTRWLPRIRRVSPDSHEFRATRLFFFFPNDELNYDIRAFWKWQMVKCWPSETFPSISAQTFSVSSIEFFS